MLALPREYQAKETASAFKHEASPTCSSSYNDWTPTSSRASSASPVPKANLPAGDVRQSVNSHLEGADPSSMIKGQNSCIPFRSATSITGVHVEHPGTNVLWHHLTKAVQAACSLPPKSRRVTTTMDQCYRDVLLAEPMPEHLLKILPGDSDAAIMAEGIDVAQLLLDDLDLQVDDDASKCAHYIMDEIKSELPYHCAGLHWKFADNLLSQTIERFGGILALVFEDQTRIEEIVYVWLDLVLSTAIYIGKTDDEKLEYQSMTESTKRSIIPLGLLGACRKSLSALESYDRLIVCLDFLLDHNNHTFAPDDKVLLPKEWIDDALEALANGVSRYAVYMRGVAQQAAINLQRAEEFEEAK